MGDTLHSHTLKVRRLYCLCVLMFTTDSRCNTPLHLLLTDMVEMCGGNTELIKTLNRIGAVAALETHRRLVTKVVEERLQRGIKDELTTGAFALASADNLDQNAPYAGVYSGDQSRGWQVVEPCPTQLRCSGGDGTPCALFIKDELTTGAFALASADNLDQNAPYAGVYSGDQSRGWQVVEPCPTQLRCSAQEYTHFPQRFLSQLAQKESILLPEAQPMDAPPYSTSHSDLPAAVISPCSKETYLVPRAPAGRPQVPMHHWRKCKR